MKRLLLFFSITLSASAQVSYDSYSSLHWRSIGPYRAGRVSAVAGVPSQPNLYYIGTPEGGVWKTTDAGQVWKPIFDKVGVSTIGAVAVAESNPNIIYVGTGEIFSDRDGQSPGNGVYKSTDAGQTWTNIGLAQTHVIAEIDVDPKNPGVVIVAAAGDIHSGAERGIYKSNNGGKDWKKVLFKDNDTGVMDMCMAVGDPKIMYATLWHRPPPGAPPSPPNAKQEQDGFIYRSTDEGSSWQQVGGKGLPTEPMNRVGVAAAPGAKSKTVYAIADQGFFRSDDMGDTWQQTTKDPRITGSSYFDRIFVDPTDSNSIYVAQTSMYHSTDGGKTFTAVFGAPSGDDYHLLWINPVAPQYMLIGVDQGAIVSVNRGATWSNWYNQPTGQFYHVTTDDRFPYYVYAAQQDSGTVAVASRSDFGEITDRDWAPTGGFEFSFIAPDPLNTNLVYIGGWYGSIVRFDRTTGQVSPVFVRTPKYRTAGMAPVAFSPQNKKTLYVGAQFVMKSDDGGAHWSEISPELTKVELPSSATPADRARNNNANISIMALSSAAENLIWAGTSNGLIHVTRDATSDPKSWQNVTPAGLPERSFINELEASPHDPATAYATIIAQRDTHPYIYRTRDFGKSWQKVVDGLAPGFIARVVREDPARMDLLYAGTENGAYISFDAGDHWQSLQLDLPATPVRDMKIHGDDLIIATYGRSLYILDNVTPLRQLASCSQHESVGCPMGAPPARFSQVGERTAGNTPSGSAFLFTPQHAIRVRWDNNQDTPYPVETPSSPNPPDGAIIDYFLKSPLSADAATNMKLQIFDAQHNLVREYSTKPDAYDSAPKNVPEYWFKENAALTNRAGINRFVWDLRFPTPQTLRYGYFGGYLDYIEYSYSDHAIPGETPHETLLGPLALPGDYTVELTVNGQKFTQPLTVSLDPRVHVSNADLQAQLDTERNIAAQMATTYAAYNQLTTLKSALDDRKKSLPAAAPQTSSNTRPSGIPLMSDAPLVSGDPLMSGAPSNARGFARWVGERTEGNTTSESVASKDSDDSPITNHKSQITNPAGCPTLSDTNVERRVGERTEGNTPSEETSLEDRSILPITNYQSQITNPPDPLSQLDAALTKLRDGTQREPGFGPINRELTRLAGMIGSGDARPASALIDAVQQSCEQLSQRVAQWKDFASNTASPLTAANIYLHDHNLQPLPALGVSEVPPPPACNK